MLNITRFISIVVVTSLALFSNFMLFPTDILSQPKVETRQPSSSSSEKKVEETTQSSSEAPPTEETTASSTNESIQVKTPEPEQDQSAPAAAPVPETAAEVANTPEVTVPPTPQTQPLQLTINGNTIPYTNAGRDSGQAVIDANPNTAATWGGAVVQSGTDGLNTHIIGHNTGVFGVLFSLGIGSPIQVSEANGQLTTYRVQKIVTVDDNGVGVDGVDYWDQITGTGGGERITLQTCITDSLNLIIFAGK